MKKAWKLKFGERFLQTKDIKETILPGKVSMKPLGFKVQTVDEISWKQISFLTVCNCTLIF